MTVWEVVNKENVVLGRLSTSAYDDREALRFLREIAIEWALPMDSLTARRVSG